MSNCYAIIKSHMLQVGDQFDHFQISAFLSQGGMSEVYRAYDLIHRKEVVLKVPSSNLIGDPAQYERFQREKEVLQTLQHPAVLHGQSCGQYNRIPYLAMDLVEGQSLRDLIAARAPLPPEEALPLFIQIADGIAYCHANGVIHRDLKPENIIINNAGQPVIMDFGLALTRGAHRVTYSNLSSAMGTPEYMAPEQVEGRRGDERTDVYALGAILFELLSGQPPFAGDNPLAVMAQHVQRPAPRLDTLRPGLDLHLAAVTARALQRAPQARYASAGEMIDALQHPETADLSVLETSAAAPAPWWQSGYLKAVALGFAILAALAILAFALQALRP